MYMYSTSKMLLHCTLGLGSDRVLRRIHRCVLPHQCSLVGVCLDSRLATRLERLSRRQNYKVACGRVPFIAIVINIDSTHTCTLHNTECTLPNVEIGTIFATSQSGQLCIAFFVLM